MNNKPPLTKIFKPQTFKPGGLYDKKSSSSLSEKSGESGVLVDKAPAVVGGMPPSGIPLNGSATQSEVSLSEKTPSETSLKRHATNNDSDSDEPHGFARGFKAGALDVFYKNDDLATKDPYQINNAKIESTEEIIKNQRILLSDEKGGLYAKPLWNFLGQVAASANKTSVLFLLKEEYRDVEYIDDKFVDTFNAYTDRTKLLLTYEVVNAITTAYHDLATSERNMPRIPALEDIIDDPVLMAQFARIVGLQLMSIGALGPYEVGFNKRSVRIKHGYRCAIVSFGMELDKNKIRLW